MVDNCARTELQRGEAPVGEAQRPAGESQRQGEDGRVQCAHLDGAQWPGEDGVQGGDLQQYDHWLWETRHQGLHMDTSQGQGRLGSELEIRKMYK